MNHRKLDSQTLIQRNKNVLQDIVKRHAIEAKRTLQFLRYALGKRSKDPGQALAVQQTGSRLPMVATKNSIGSGHTRSMGDRGSGLLRASQEGKPVRLPHLMNK